MSQEFLSGLDALDWSELEHAYGSAEDVPNLIRSLASEDADEAYEAFETLYELIWHPDSWHDATQHSIPFVIEIIGRPDLPIVSDLIQMLSHMLDDIYPNSARDLRIRGAIRAGIPTYIQALGHPSIRNEISELLANFHHDCASIAPQILSQLSRTTDVQTQYILIDTLKSLLIEPSTCTEIDDYIAALMHLQTSNEKALALISSQTLLLLGQGNDDSVEIVKSAIMTPEAYILPTVDANPLRMTAIRTASLDALGALPPDQGIDAIAAIVTALDGQPSVKTPPTQSRGLFDAMQDSVKKAMSDVESGAAKADDILSESGIKDMMQNMFASFQNFSLGDLTASSKKHANNDFTIHLLFTLFALGFADVLRVKIDNYSLRHESNGQSEFIFSDNSQSPMPTWDRLSKAQLRVLQLIATHDIFWRVGHNILALHGFPNERQALQTFVATHK